MQKKETFRIKLNSNQEFIYFRSFPSETISAIYARNFSNA